MTEHTPQEAPPSEEAIAGTAAASPSEEPPDEAQEAYVGAGTAPTESPPTAVGEEREGFGAVWHNNKKITGLWTSNQNRNSWFYVEGVGWKKIADNSDTAVVALTILASHALQTGVNVNALEDAGKVTQIYAW